MVYSSYKYPRYIWHLAHFSMYYSCTHVISLTLLSAMFLLPFTRVPFVYVPVEMMTWNSMITMLAVVCLPPTPYHKLLERTMYFFYVLYFSVCSSTYSISLCLSPQWCTCIGPPTFATIWKFHCRGIYIQVHVLSCQI